MMQVVLGARACTASSQSWISLKAISPSVSFQTTRQMERRLRKHCGIWWNSFCSRSKSQVRKVTGPAEGAALEFLGGSYVHSAMSRAARRCALIDDLDRLLEGAWPIRAAQESEFSDAFGTWPSWRSWLSSADLPTSLRPSSINFSLA